MLAAAEMSAAAALVEAAAEETLMRSEIVTFLRWIEALPEAEVRARPLLCVYHAAALLVSGQPFAGVEKRLVDAADAAAGAADAGAVVVLRALIAVFRGEASRGAQLAEQAIAQLPSQSHFLHSLVAQSLAVAQMLHGDIHAAIASLETAAAAAEAAGNVMLHIVALCHIAELHMLGGRLLKARALYERALVEAVDRAGQPLPIAGMAHLGLGELARERNDLVTAVSTLETGIALIKRWGEIGAMDGYISLARLRQAQGQTAAAREWMAAARRIATRFDATDIDDVFVDLMLLPLMIEQGEAAAAVARWEAHRERLDAADLPFHIWEMDKLARARLALARRRPEAALTHLAEMIPRSVGLGRDGILIQARLLQARAQQQAGRPVAARQAAAQAVQLAEPGRYVRIFLDEGPLIRDLLAARRREMSEQTPLPPARQQRLRYLDELLAAFAAEAGAPQPIVAPAVDLSPRQVEVLRLIAAGMSNREIAARLMIAHSTVKTHINQIYRKLDVTSRREALQRAQTLDVL
jgi:LuxR family maltose regulon positive regulatory protein